MNESDVHESSNVAVLRGVVRGDPTIRELPSGGTVAQFDVATTIGSGHATERVVVPVAWSEPATSSRAWLVDATDLVVVGTVRRRFFRVGGATQSRTEVVADRVVPARRRTQAASAVNDALARLAGP